MKTKYSDFVATFRHGLFHSLIVFTVLDENKHNIVGSIYILELFR